MPGGAGMRLLSVLIGFTWLAFMAVWIVSSLFAKRTVSRSLRFWLVRVAIIALVVIDVRRHAHGTPSSTMLTHHVTIGVIGVVLCMAGIAIAFWARFFIGRNWGMPMSRKADPELVTTGPYRYVRHPIYTGVLLAMLGTALVMGWPWLVILALMIGYFTWSARTEEKYLMAQFPDAYPAYRARTRMLVPLVL
jgi:protein-S-isoprenylcysteine O-methyltransferase Ste14